MSLCVSSIIAGGVTTDGGEGGAEGAIMPHTEIKITEPINEHAIINATIALYLPPQTSGV